MKNVELQPLGKVVEVKTNERVLDAMLAKELNVLMACGGKGMCATCHVWIDKGMDELTPMSAREKRTLSRVSGCDERSRLSCQAKILGEGVVVRLPDGMFIESTKDLESLIGQRSKTNILHPIDGRILVERGKIITRSRIMQLEELDVDMNRLRQEAENI
ncbi:MAG: 2Fe-2S iron-sulfur cluster-binding protein [Candidatus Sumerlaeia bacterium]|nr:2Fe-2S iron-sulfur cluster-binding protein [Candidatus Sumerlaeia bacterium]